MTTESEQRADASLPFFDACARGELLVQRCASCGSRQFYPRIWCTTCDSTDLAWEQVSGDGKLVTFSIVRRAPSEAHRARVPYILAIVKLAEGPQMMATIVNSDSTALVPGMAVRVVPSVDVAPCFELTGPAS